MSEVNGSSPVHFQVGLPSIGREEWAELLKAAAIAAGLNWLPSQLCDSRHVLLFTHEVNWTHKEFGDLPQLHHADALNLLESRAIGSRRKDKFPSVSGRCPNCKMKTLFLGEGGFVTCGAGECSDPCAANDLLESTESDVDPGTIPVTVLVGQIIKRVQYWPTLCYELEEFREDVFLELPETRRELLIGLGTIINKFCRSLDMKTVPAEWKEIKELMTIAIRPYLND